MTCETFATRADLVAWAAATAAPVGSVAFAAGYAYRCTGMGAPIADLPGWVPMGDVYPDHWAQNLSPGATDMRAAILAALGYSATVLLAGCTYAVGATLSWNNGSLIGAGAWGAMRSTLRGLAALIPAGQAIVAPGRSSSVCNIQISYDSLTGGEAQFMRVGLDTRGLGQTLQRGAVIDQVRFDNVGTAISDYGTGEFSVTYGTIEIAKHSFRAVDLCGENRTGSFWQNIYINGGNTYSPEGGFCTSGQSAGGVIGQLNVEHQTYSGYPVRIEGQHGLVINALHIEGVDVVTAGRGYLGLDASSVSIHSLNALNTRMSADETAVVRLSGAGYHSAWFSTPLACASPTSTLRIGVLHLKGLASPENTKYPTYPVTRTGVRKCAGFNVFKRDPVFTDVNWRVDIGAHIWAAFPAQAADRPYIEFPRVDYSGSIAFQ